MATMSKAEFMDYYFTRTEKNSPPRVREEKDLTQRARRLDHRAQRRLDYGGLDLSEMDGAQRSCAPTRQGITRLVSVRIGMSADQGPPLAVRRCRCRTLDRRGG